MTERGGEEGWAPMEATTKTHLYSSRWKTGQLDEARVLYERLLDYRNQLGLFSEMIDPPTGEALGKLDPGGLDISSAKEVA